MHSSISAYDFVRAVDTHCEPVVDLYLSEHLDPNARVAQGCTLLLTATLQQDWATVRRLLDAGAHVDIVDDTGFSPLMAAAMHRNLEIFRDFLARCPNLDTGTRCRDGRDLLSIALDAGKQEIIKAVLERLPPMQQWTGTTRRALDAALRAGDKEQIGLLLHKHAAPPTPEGRSVPLLAYAIASDDASLFAKLLTCGADPNTTLPAKYDKDFLASLPSKFRNYIEDDRNVTVLMLAAGIGRSEYVQALLEAGADRHPDKALQDACA